MRSFLNKAIYTTASAACGWAGAVMQVVITVWLENHSKVKQYRPTNWPTNQKTDQQTDEQTDQPTDQLTKWLIKSRARDYKAILLRIILVLKEYWILLTGVDWDWRGESGHGARAGRDRATYETRYVSIQY